MKKNKGFTLVELLAVIVILAIIMIIAIPAVLETMQSAQKKSFTEYATKVSTEAQKVYLKDQLESNPGTCALYNIKKDLGLSSTGDYDGYVLVKNENDNHKIYVTLKNNDYMIYAVDDSILENAEVKNLIKDSTYLSDVNILSVANCANYTVKVNDTSYEQKTQTLIDNPQSSTPVVTTTTTKAKKLFTGEKEGAYGWVGVYVNGEITECYNKEGDIGPDGKQMNNGNKTNYCTSRVNELNDFTKCEKAKSTICCTDVTDLSTPLHAYSYVLNENQAISNYPHKSCGYYYDPIAQKWTSFLATAGGLPASGVYEE